MRVDFAGEGIWGGGSGLKTSDRVPGLDPGKWSAVWGWTAKSILVCR